MTVPFVKSFSFTQCVVFWIAFFVLSFTQANANALTTEFCFGAGYLGPDDMAGRSLPLPSFHGSYGKGGVDFVFSPWTRADIVVGAEYAEASPYGDHRPVDYSYDIASALLGVRYKLITRERGGHIYAALVGLAGKAYYKANFSNRPNLAPVDSNRGSASFIRPRLAVGWIISITKRLSLVVEASLTGALPSSEIAAVDKTTGQIENIPLNNGGADMGGMTYGLRYAF
jgi:hypothetical protein